METLRTLRNLLDGAFGMCLFSGILKNPCLLIYVRLRFFLKFYRAKQTYFTKIAETRGFNYCLSAL